MRLERSERRFLVTLTGQELAALFAAARMARDSLRAEPETSPEALGLLRRLIDEYERGLERIGATERESS